MKNLAFILAVFFTFSCTGQQTIDNRKKEIVFRNVSIIPMDKNEMLSGHDVVVKNGVITAIGKTSKVKFGTDALVIDCKGKFLMPGLAEMHAHVPPIDDIEPMKDVLILFALNGVTTIRGMLGHPRHIELRSKIESGEIIGPRFITAGPSFSGNSVKTPEAAVAMVQEEKKMGYDFLKLHPGLSKETFAAVVSTARSVGIPFAGHVSFDVGVWWAARSGYATIDHLDGFVESLVPGIENMKEQEAGLFGLFIADKADEKGIPKLMDSLRTYHIWVVPTLSLGERWFHPERTADALSSEPEMKYMDPNTVKGWITAKKNLVSNPNFKAATVMRLLELRKKLLYECNKNGIGLLLGSDAPQIFDVPGFSVHHELRYMVDAGLSPYDALRSGTVNVGRFLKRDDIGIVKVGAKSDLVLLNGNPLTDIDQSNNIEGVMLGNLWMGKQYRDAEFKKLEKNK